MSTVEEVADRALREFVLPNDDQPIHVTLDGDITSNATTLVYDDATLAPDEEELLAPGVLIEIGLELLRITAADFDTNTLTVVRGIHGTLADAHDDGDDITVAPLILRSAVVEAVKDEVESLYPALWHIDTYQLTTASTYVEVPSDSVSLISLTVQDGNDWFTAPLPTLLTNFPESSTDQAILCRSVPADRTAYLTYRAKFSRPSTAATELADVGVEDRWERIVAVGAAATVVASRPQDILSVEYITEQLERESQPPGSVMDVRNGLLTLKNIWLDEAVRSLRAQQDTPVKYNRSARR